MEFLRRSLGMVFCVLILTVLFPSTTKAGSIELAAAMGTASAGCYGWTQAIQSLTSASSVYVACDQFSEIPTTPDMTGEKQWQGGFALASFSTPIMADVVGAASYWDGFGAGSAFAGYAGVNYLMAVEELDTPPATVTVIPVTLFATGSTYVSGIGSAYSWVTFNGVKFWTPVVLDLNLVPNTAYFGSVWARCDAWVGSGWQYSECQAVTDPVFQFNQAAFDVQMGEQTFPLSRYYGFSFSPNLVPEPSSALLIVAGTLCLTCAVRRGARRVCGDPDR